MVTRCCLQKSLILACLVTQNERDELQEKSKVVKKHNLISGDMDICRLERPSKYSCKQRTVWLPVPRNSKQCKLFYAVVLQYDYCIFCFGFFFY